MIEIYFTPGNNLGLLYFKNEEIQWSHYIADHNGEIRWFNPVTYFDELYPDKKKIMELND